MSARSRSPTTKYRSHFSEKEQEVLDDTMYTYAFKPDGKPQITVWHPRYFNLPGTPKFAVSYIEGQGAQIYPSDKENYKIIVDRVRLVMKAEPHYDTSMGTHWF